MTQMAVGFRCLFPEIGGRVAALLLLAGACQSPEPTPAPPPPPAEVVAPVAPVAPESEAEAATAHTLEELRAAATADPEAALAEFDAATAAHAADPAFWEAYGDANLALFERGLAAGRPNGFLLEDADGCYVRALELDAARIDARLGSLRVRRHQGDVSGAWEQAFTLWQRGTSTLPAVAAEEIGRAGLDVTIEALQRGEPAPAVARVAQSALEAALAAGRGAASVPLFDLHAWQGQDEAASQAALRGLLADPPVETAYERLRSFGGARRNLHVGVLEEARRARPKDALLLWYLGEALFFQGRESRSAFDTLKARECFDRADEAFALAQAERPELAATCQEWQHLIRVQRGWTTRDEGRAAEAAVLVLDALRLAPERLEPAPDPDSMRLLIEAVVADHLRAEDWAAARAFLREVCRLHEGDANWFNNLGFFSRELGVAAAARGESAAAAADFEESWVAYSRAAEMAPEDARIVNDRALIAVYYLDEHWDLAERDLHRAIEVGSRQLAEMSPDVPEAERRYVDEAVGDAWENLAHLQLIRRRQTAGVADFLDQSLRHYPFQQRAGVARLREALAQATAPN